MSDVDRRPDVFIGEEVRKEEDNTWRRSGKTNRKDTFSASRIRNLTSPCVGAMLICGGIIVLDTAEL